MLGPFRLTVREPGRYLRNAEDAMGKVVYWMTVSLDGFVETRDGAIDWTMPDEGLFRS